MIGLPVTRALTRAGCMALALALLAGAAPAKKAARVAPARKAPAALSKPSGPVDFKGVPMGITLEEFRARPHPDGSRGVMMCSNDVGLEESPSSIMVLSDERAAGVIKCAWADPEYSDYTERLELPPARAATTRYSFNFIPDPADGTPRLFQFVGTTLRSAQSGVMEGLTAKWGAPKVVEDKVYNGLGQALDRVTAVWLMPSGSITIEAPAPAANEMMIVVSDRRLAEVYKSAVAAQTKGTAL